MSDVEPCPSCGQAHVRKDKQPSCAGHIIGGARPERKGQPCLAMPRRGQRVCSKHGGSAPAALAAAEERLARQESEAELERLASLGARSGVTDPGEVVLEQIQWRHGHVQWLRARVQAIDPDALVWGRTKEKIGGEDFGITREAKPNVWLQLYLEASEKLEKLCIAAINAGIEERRVRIAENNGEALVRLIDATLRDLGLDPNDRKVAGVVARHLRAVS